MTIFAWGSLFLAILFFLDNRYFRKENKLLEEENKLLEESINIQKDIVKLKNDESEINFKIATVGLKALTICIERIKENGEFNGITIWLHDQYWQITWDEKERHIIFNSNPDISKEDMEGFDVFIN